MNTGKKNGKWLWILGWVALLFWLIIFFPLMMSYSSKDPNPIKHIIFFLIFPTLFFLSFVISALRAKKGRALRLLGAIVVFSVTALTLFARYSMLSDIEASKRCPHNLKMVAVAILTYAYDNNERLPDSTCWVDSISPYLEGNKLFHCGADKSNARCSYAMNSNLSGKSLQEIGKSEELILLFETTQPGDNPAGTAADLPVTGRHRGCFYIALADGSIKLVDPAKEPPPYKW